MEINQILPYLNNGTKVYVFDSPKFLKEYLKKYPDGQATLEIKIDNVEELVFKDKYKPILRPISDFNFHFTQLWDSEIDVRTFTNEDFLIKFNIETEEKMIVTKMEWYPVGLLNLLVTHKFDVFGLIEKGLAIDVNEFDVAVY